MPPPQLRVYASGNVFSMRLSTAALQGVWLLAHLIGVYVLYVDWNSTLITLIGLTLMILSLASSYRLTQTAPGNVPPGWAEYVTTHAIPVSLSDPKSFHPRSAVMCPECKQSRPERAFHCSDCGVCITRMDHHSPFLDCCIGLRNSKLYWVACLYGTVFFAFTSTLSFYKTSGFGRATFAAKEQPSVFGTIVFGGLFMVALAHFVGFTMRLSSNRTFSERDFTARNPYDLGARLNMEGVLGVFGITWLVPSNQEFPDNAGLFFPVKVAAVDVKYGTFSSQQRPSKTNS